MIRQLTCFCCLRVVRSNVRIRFQRKPTFTTAASVNSKYSPAHSQMRRSSRRSGAVAVKSESPERANKRPRRQAQPPPSPPSDAEASADEETTAKPQPKNAPVTSEEGPSAYELARLENMKRNAMVMASLGLSGAKAGGMRATVKSDAAQRAKARGLPPRQPKAYPPRSRESARVRGKTPDGKPMEDPEEAFNRNKKGFGVPTASEPEPPRERQRLTGDVSMSASNATPDGTLRLRQMMGGLVGRYDADVKPEEYDLAKPDEALERLRGLTVDENGVCKVVRERAYSVAWHPSDAKLLLAVGDKVGNLGLWAVDADDNGDDDGVYQFKPHTGSIPRLEFDALDGNKVVSTSYDGTVRRMDVEKGAFEQIFANDANDDSYFTDGHLVAEERTLMLSDGVGDITAVDLRTNKQIWKREAHEKKANTVHTHPTKRHLFVTASLDRSVKLWDARNLGAGTGSTGVGGMKPVAEMPHFRSVNSAHFSPGGEWVATVGQDDKIRLYKDLAAEASGSQVSALHVMPHDNQTGKWLTKFQASWDPKSTGMFGIGSKQKHPHGVHLYSVNGSSKKPSAVEVTGGDVMTSIQSLVAFHPVRDVVAGVNSSGRAHVFK